MVISLTFDVSIIERHKQKDQRAGLFVFVCLLLGYRHHLLKMLSRLLDEGGREGRCPRFSALLRSLVSPRDRARSPDRLTEHGTKAHGEHWGGGVCVPGSDLSSLVRTLQSRENDSHVTMSIILSVVLNGVNDHLLIPLTPLFLLNSFFLVLGPQMFVCVSFCVSDLLPWMSVVWARSKSGHHTYHPTSAQALGLY